MPIPTWPKIKKSLPTNVQREFKGVNRLDKFSIPDDFASDMSNVTSLDYPVMKTRPGYSLAGSALPARILGLFSFKNTEMHTVSNGNWYRLVAGVWTSIGNSLSTAAEYSFTHFQGGFSAINILGTNGVDARRWDGTTFTTISGFPSGGDYIESFQERVWCVTTQNGIKNQLNFSEYRVATNWTTITQSDTDPGFIVVEDNAGEPIIGVHAGNSHLTIFKPNSIYELYGYTPQDFRLINVTHEVGAVSNQAWATAKGVQYFIHTTGIYRYSGGTLPDEDFSRPVQDYVSRMNVSAKAKCCCGTDGIMVWFAMPIDGATENNIVLEYNTEFGIWCVWQGFAPTHMANQLGQLYIGNVDGSVRQVGGTTDNGTAIAGYWTTKVFGGGSYAQKVRWKRSWVTADVPPGSTLQVYMTGKPDGLNDFTLVQNVPNTTGVNSARVIVPTGAAYFSDFITQKFAFFGPVRIKEWAREQDDLPIY